MYLAKARSASAAPCWLERLPHLELRLATPLLRNLALAAAMALNQASKQQKPL